jgi:hypothetical protein
MASNDEKSTKRCCILLWYCCLKLTINQNVYAFALIRCLCSFATGWKALHALFELKQLAECRSRAAEKLVVLAERKPRPADKLDGLAECKSRVSDKSGFADGSRAAVRLNLLMGKSCWQGILGTVGCSNWLAKYSSSDFLPWHSPRELADWSRATGKVFWELSVAAIDCSTKDSSSDFLPWHSPQELADGSRATGKVFWELSVAAIGCSAKDSSSDYLP